MVLRRSFLAGLLALAGCGGITEGDNTLPGHLEDPAETRTPEGALGAYQGVLDAFRVAFGGSDHVNAITAGALLADEFGSSRYGEPVFGQPEGLDRRYLPELTEVRDIAVVYGSLHRVRGEASEALGLLATYAPASSPALRAHLWALGAYAEVFLADLYCSGIPLSTLDFDGDYTLRPGSTTEEVYRHALALFDSAAPLAADDARIVDLVRVGRGRALLALGRYAEAGAAVASVPDGFSYAVQYDQTGRNFMDNYVPDNSFQWPGTVTDREGGTGLDYRSSGDPRVAAGSVGNNHWNVPIYAPAKYELSGEGPIVLADGLEARLIEAEAALQAGDPATWLAKLNHLRQTAWPTIRPPVAGALPDTTDPGSDAGRVDLMFRERAFWLFLTGHRQGDLRRLVRQYERDAASIYPRGAYPDGYGRYGTDVTLPVPRTEGERNPYYTGCIDRRA